MDIIIIAIIAVLGFAIFLLGKVFMKAIKFFLKFLLFALIVLVVVVAIVLVVKAYQFNNPQYITYTSGAFSMEYPNWSKTKGILPNTTLTVRKYVYEMDLMEQYVGPLPVETLVSDVVKILHDELKANITYQTNVNNKTTIEFTKKISKVGFYSKAEMIKCDNKLYIVLFSAVKGFERFNKKTSDHVFESMKCSV